MSEVRCPCGAWVWEPPGAEVPGWGTAGGPTRERRAYCWGCRSELGERDGTPVVTPMVPRAALAGVLPAELRERAQELEAEVERLTAEVERLRRALAELQVAVEDLEDSGARGVPALITAASRAVAVLRLQDAQAALAAGGEGGG